MNASGPGAADLCKYTDSSELVGLLGVGLEGVRVYGAGTSYVHAKQLSSLIILKLKSTTSELEGTSTTTSYFDRNDRSASMQV